LVLIFSLFLSFFFFFFFFLSFFLSFYFFIFFIFYFFLCSLYCVFVFLWVSKYGVCFCCSYQLEALELAIKQNTIVFLDTGSGKTLIAIMLLRSYAYLLRKPSPFIAVFLVPQVVLVSQVC